MPRTNYQKEPFRITLSGHGSFNALAADGKIVPRTKKAARNTYSPRTREVVEAYAFAYLGRKEWEWEIPEKFKEEVDDRG